MRKCNKCKIKYNGNLKRCPLCNSELVGTKSDGVFPKIKSKDTGLIYKILLFVSIVISVLFSFIEYNITKNFNISTYVVFGLITNFILVTFILKNYSNVLRMLNRYFLVLFILLVLWYFVTRSLFITTFLIPILCIVIFIFNSIVLLILRDRFIQKYAKTIILDCFVGLIPYVLVLFNLSIYPLISSICLILDLIVFVGLFIFFHDNIIDEFKKIFNF